MKFKDVVRSFPPSSFAFSMLFGLAGVLAPSGAMAANTGLPQNETRGLWVTRWDFRTPEDVRAIIRNAASHYFNVVFFQVRGEATVFYRSKIEPWAWELTGKTPASTGQDPGWDPLATALAEARAAGVELHAYMNTLPGWKQTTDPPKASGHVRVAHPDWFMFTRDHKPMPVAGFYAFLNPIHPEVKSHLVSVCEEVARNYDVDGIHLDYIRFPGEFAGGDLAYDPVSLELFKKQYHATPQQQPEAWDAFRATHVSDVVKRIYTALKAIKPSLMVSAAATADYQSAVKENRQTSLEWLNGGYVDCLVPMNYTADVDLFRRRGQVFLNNRRRGLVYMGMMAEKGEKAVRAEIAASRAMGSHGVAVFAYSTLFPEHKPSRLARVLKDEVFVRPSRVVGRVYSD